MSNDQDKLKITYRPDLDYKKNYNTIGSSKNDINSDNSDNTTDSSFSNNTIKIEDIRNHISDINRFIIYLPTEVSTIVFDLNMSIKQTLPYIKDIDKSRQNTDSDNNSNNNGNNNPDNSNNDNDSINNNTKSNMSNGKIINLPSSSLDSDVIYAPKKIDAKKSNTLIDAFDYIVLSIYDDYLSSLKNGITTYQINMTLANNMSDTNELNAEYNTNTADIELNKKHLSDNIIRSEYIYNQKVRLLQKMFTFKNAISHFKSVYSAKQFCDRYDSESPIRNDNNRKDKFIRDTWLATKNAYYNKYSNSISNMYKYYDSCADLISDCLNIKAQSYTSRIILNK